MLLPELAEPDATGELATIYADIRRLGGVPMVALIFRHLATRPGVLEWMWSAIGPAWRSGRLQEAAWRVARDAPLEPVATMPRACLRAWSVDAAAEQQIRDVLVAYNRANPENMLTILCALRLVHGKNNWGRTPIEETRGGESSKLGYGPNYSWSPPPSKAIAPMADITRLQREVSELLDLVAAPGEAGSPRVVQSLYRHFCHRPAFLAAIVTLLRQRFDDGSIDRAMASLHVDMSREADAIVESMAAPAAPDPGIEAVCRRFSGAVIPQMIVVGRLLEDAFPETVSS